MEMLWKDTVPAEFWTIHPKLCGNCAFPQYFHIRKKGENLVFYVVLRNFAAYFKSNFRQQENSLENFKLKTFILIFHFSIKI